MTWKMRGRLAGLLIVFSCFAVANAGESSLTVAAEGDPVVNFDRTHLAMNAAQDEARLHLAKFFDHALTDRGTSIQNSAVKVAVPIGDDGHEVIWVTPFVRKGDRFIGLLANEPVEITGKHAGDQIMFSEKDVRDWYFIGSDGRMYGSYTTRAMLPDLTPAQVQQISALLSKSPIPAAWSTK